MSYRNLTSMQLDALREVFNIGCGNSATSLSTLLNRKIDMSVPKINIIDFNSIFDNEAEVEIISVIVKVIGEAPGNILFAFKEDVASKISKSLTGSELDMASEVGISVIGEIGNIISSAYMNAIATFTNLKLMPSVPAVTYDVLSAILASAFIEAGQVDDYILKVETLFKGDTGEDVMGNFYYIPEPGSLENILIKLGMG